MGLETGLCRMKKGERAELTMEPKYGFGKAGLKSKVGGIIYLHKNYLQPYNLTEATKI